MSSYYFSCEMHFFGKDYEIEILKSLLSLMEVDWEYEGGRKYLFIHDVDNEGSLYFETNEQGLHVERCGDDGLTSLTGNLDFDDWPEFELTYAPELFASLFPTASFQYSATVNYEVSDEPESIFAQYDGKNLLMGTCYDADRWEDLLKAFSKMKCSEKNWEQWLSDWKNEMNYDENKMWDEIQESYEELCEYLNLDDFPGRCNRLRKNLYIAMQDGWVNIDSPERYDEFVESFCEDEDLLLCLVKAQIKKDSTLMQPYLEDFTLEQIKECIDVAKENECENSLAVLQDICNKRFPEYAG